MNEPVETWTVKVEADTTSLQAELERVNRIGDRFARSLSRAFQDIAFRGKGLADVLKGLALQLSQLVLQAALKPLQNAMGSLIGGLLQGIMPFASGGVIRQGAPVPFAQGGIVAAPTFFPMAGGRLGLMGERGAEAIMPLARGADGRLGVRAGAAQAATSITLNIATPDAESFRRSQGQIAAVLSRTVAQGQRNL